jgi:SAM-dependent methyltransferase
VSHYLEPSDIHDMARLVTDREIPDWVEPSGEGIVLNIGAGAKKIYGALPLDIPDWNADSMPIPFEDESVEAIYAIHFLGHVKYPVYVLRECQRVLMPGGLLNIGVPYWHSMAAHQDLDHKSFFCEETWKTLFTNDYYEKNHDGWKFKVGTNFLFGLNERNLMLITQLIRTDYDV